ncbi:hypothetical protein DY000_02017994 [Brassica cretica]|uniref:Uncharacterized protein n=1 Tax=Brassica cretica TaxID=69181 RepID=A0ABQ7D929_BRACR|nr:hypothetical protein DY000_02017994 [Brassica cretica]
MEIDLQMLKMPWGCWLGIWVMKNLVAFGARKEESSESSDSDVDTDSEDYHVLLNKWLNLKNENLRLQHDLVQSREQYDDLDEELVVKGLSHFVHGSTSKSGAKGACQQVCREVRQGVRQEVLQRATVSNKPKVLHQCNNMKVRQEVLKHGCAAGTRKETDRCIINYVRPSKKQHRI